MAKIHELTPEQFQKAYDEWRECAAQDPHEFWSEFIVDDTVRDAAEKSIEVDPKSFQWSVYGGQGDGATFSASAHINDYITKSDLYADFMLLYEVGANDGHHCNYVEVSNKQYRSSMYYTNDVYCGGEIGQELTDGIMAGVVWTEELDDLYNKQLEKLCEHVLEQCNNLAHELHSNLEDAYDYHVSEESFREWAESSDEDFEVEEEDEYEEA